MILKIQLWYLYREMKNELTMKVKKMFLKPINQFDIIFVETFVKK